ncbi:MAG: winged helix-turn-helix domain-containing protein, partial [bacterium]|nr:winged helix-turn-helix domain-containing protein [bacterium]
MTSEQHYATVARLSDSLSDGTNKPRYRRLKDGLTRAIESGELRGGAMLPSSRVLADHLDVSRNTVNRAYRELVVEG